MDSNLFQNYRLMAPGPVPLHPRVRDILSKEMIHHRTPLFDGILKRVLGEIKNIFQTTQPVYLMSGTGSSAMEASLVNVLSPGDEILCIVSGKFGERWTEIAHSYQIKAHQLSVPWGESVRLSDVEKALKQNSNIKAVLCQACETSTAVLHPIRELGELIASHSNALFIVDGITAVGAVPLPMDEWKIDVLAAGSQKAFMLPTGLSFISFSQKAQKLFETAKCPRYYLDIRKEKAANEKGETFFSSSVTLIRALDVALQIMLEKGLSSWLHQIERRAQFTRFAARVLGLELYSRAPSASLTALKVPSQVDGAKWRLRLEEKYNLTVMGGQDQLKGQIIRIGHMGYIEDQDLLVMAQALYMSLKDVHIDISISDSDFWKQNQIWLNNHP